MLHEASLDLDRGDILAAANDDVLEPVANLDVAVGMDHGCIARMEPAILDRGSSRRGIVVVALHNDIAAHGDLAQRPAVVWHFAAVFADDPQLAGADQLNALASLDPG